MMETDKLRKADIFSGGLILLFGLWVVSQALKMPMQDSWGGVQNVWYVSPAIFPLFVGAMISLLGGVLVRKALATVGVAGFKSVIAWLASSELAVFMKTAAMMRFYAITVLFFTFVFMNVPRVDFFLGAMLFLLAFITMFYFDDEILLKRLLVFYIGGSVVMLLGFVTGALTTLPYAADVLTLVFICAYAVYARKKVSGDVSLTKKYYLCLLLAIVAPLLIGTIFKFLLLVPMPMEGMVSLALEAAWYSVF